MAHRIVQPVTGLYRYIRTYSSALRSVKPVCVISEGHQCQWRIYGAEGELKGLSSHFAKERHENEIRANRFLLTFYLDNFKLILFRLQWILLVSRVQYTRS